MKKWFNKKRNEVMRLLLVPALGLSLIQVSPAAAEYLTGDFHQHTTYSDGSYSYDFMMKKNNEFGLDWWANSGHGGGFTRDGRYGRDNGGNVYWDSYTPNPIIGDVKISGGHQVMWRWQSLRNYNILDLLKAQGDYPDKMIYQGLEWNIPGHEHCSTSIITEQFDPINPNTNALAEFEYKFDKNDSDIGGGAAQGWVKSTLPNLHEKSVEGVAWMQAYHRFTSYAIPAHPERQGVWQPNKTSTGYNIEHFRDMNNAGPDVCFGFEGIPGHQADVERGGFSPTKAVAGGTYGGTGYYTATVGGLWDALLGEGRRWWNFASSDCHLHWTDGGEDFYPGEYQKTYVYVEDKDNIQSYINGLRSGNSFVVSGDLINALDFTIFDRSYPKNRATMGQELVLRKNKPGIRIVIRFKSPDVNNNGDPVRVDHIDLIAGKVTGKVDPSSPNYTNPTNPTTKVIATFTENDWREIHGWKTII